MEEEKRQSIPASSDSAQAESEKLDTVKGGSDTKLTKKQALHDMLKGMIEGYDPEDEESSSEMLMKYLSEGNEQKAKIAEALKRDPRIAQMLSDIVSGKRGAAGSLVRYFGKDFLSAEEGSEEYEEILKAEEERKAEQEASEASRKEYQDNLEKSMPEVEAYCKEKGYEVDDFLDGAWTKMVQPILSGLYSKEVCEFIDKGMSYDKAALQLYCFRLLRFTEETYSFPESADCRSYCSSMETGKLPYGMGRCTEQIQGEGTGQLHGRAVCLYLQRVALANQA